MIEFEQVRLRVVSLNADVKFVDELLSNKSEYETRLWALNEQKESPDFQTPELQAALDEQINLVKKNINNSDEMLKKARIKILKSLGLNR